MALLITIVIVIYIQLLPPSKRQKIKWKCQSKKNYVQGYILEFRGEKATSRGLRQPCRRDDKCWKLRCWIDMQDEQISIFFPQLSKKLYQVVANYHTKYFFKSIWKFQRISQLRGISADNRNMVQCSFQKNVMFLLFSV